MNREQLIDVFAAFGRVLEQAIAEPESPTGLQEIMQRSAYLNPWFTLDFQREALLGFRKNFIHESVLSQWLNKYPEPVKQPKRIGLILAGNIPFVGMHDILCVLCSGHTAVIKLSSKDPYFFPWMKQQLSKMDGQTGSELANQMEFVEHLKDIDGIIATGSNNTSRYFDYYFGKYPHIFRKNRSSVAVLDGTEDNNILAELGKDVFTYFGLGCRNVSKIFMPEGYDPTRLLKVWETFNHLQHHHKYKNNLDYNLTLLMLNYRKYYASEYLALTENEGLHAPLATLYYAYYTSNADLQNQLAAISDDLQCVVSIQPGNTYPGQTQSPGLDDYADHIDTMRFLQEL
jgi:hypothetical protein